MSIPLKRLIALVLVSVTISCSNSGPSKRAPDPGPTTPQGPSAPTRLELCSEGAVQNLVLAAYAHGVVATFVIAPVVWPLESFSDSTYFEDSTIRIQIIYHAMSGDEVLYDETFEDTLQHNIELSSSSTPAYSPAIDDELTVILTTNMKTRHSGGTYTYDELTENMDFKLVDPAVNIFKVGDRKTFDNGTCPQFYSPIVSFGTTSSGSPNVFTLGFSATLFTSPLGPIVDVLSVDNASANFERDFHIRLKMQNGTLVGQFDLNIEDASNNYASPSDTLSTTLAPGTYKVEISSAANANFGSGLKSAAVIKTYTLTIADTTGDMTLDGIPLMSDYQFTFGIDEFN